LLEIKTWQVINFITRESPIFGIRDTKNSYTTIGVLDPISSAAADLVLSLELAFFLVLGLRVDFEAHSSSLSSSSSLLFSSNFPFVTTLEINKNRV